MVSSTRGTKKKACERFVFSIHGNDIQFVRNTLSMANIGTSAHNTWKGIEVVKSGNEFRMNPQHENSLRVSFGNKPRRNSYD